ncbi:MAG: hypothetical protein VKN33_08685 [Candidatus Sericytochromatia bacterium]|nr:hypothetical protein [Candidatus Sericytochromatia bacterium]
MLLLPSVVFSFWGLVALSLAGCDHLPPPAGLASGGSVSPVPHAGTGPSAGPAGVAPWFVSAPAGFPEWFTTPIPASPRPSGPFLVVPSLAPVSGNSPGPGTPTPRPSPTPTPTPRPTPTPEPINLEFDSFLLRVPHPWVVERQQAGPFSLQLRYAAGVGVLTIDVENSEDGRLDSLQSAARSRAGDGYVAQGSLTLDEVRGFQVNSNRDTSEGKRYVIERGFVYRSRAWRITSEWDKRTPEAVAVERDVSAILKTWRWL